MGHSERDLLGKHHGDIHSSKNTGNQENGRIERKVHRVILWKGGQVQRHGRGVLKLENEYKHKYKLHPVHNFAQDWQ